MVFFVQIWIIWMMFTPKLGKMIQLDKTRIFFSDGLVSEKPPPILSFLKLGFLKVQG